MKLRTESIRRKISKALFIACGSILLMSATGYLVYQLLTYRQTVISQLTVLSQVIGSNSTAALAFDSREEAAEILTALQAEPNILSACIYNEAGEVFSIYPEEVEIQEFPGKILSDGFMFQENHISGFTTIYEGDRKLGTLYLKVSTRALDQMLMLFLTGGVVITLFSIIVGYFISKKLEKEISTPVLALANTARVISEKNDFSVRANKYSDDELGFLTDSFNQMIGTIQTQNRSLTASHERFENILETMGDAFVSLNLNWEYTFVNEKALLLIGKEREALLGKTLWEVFPDSRNSIFESEYRKVMEQRVPTLFETYYPPYKIWLEIRAYPQQEGISIFYSDITARKNYTEKIQSQLSRLDLLSGITRAIGERLDLKSIFQVVIQRLEDHLPIDFGCICLFNSDKDTLEIKSIGQKSYVLSKGQINLTTFIAVQENNFSRSMNGALVYEPDIHKATSPFLAILSSLNLRSVVLAPLLVESNVFGILLAARTGENDFDSGDCEFLKQLSEHVALATHQAQLYEALQQAYEDLRQTQQSVMQQERLKALGQMSSGIAHDINNAISPVTLYTESLLENEPNLSDRARKYLEIIQQAMEDVALTVGRMREFYRKREPQLIQTRVDLNLMVNQVVELTRARWKNMPQEKGIVVEMQTSLPDGLPAILGVESEIREALTNLIFNSVDAIPEGGTVTVRTSETSAGKSKKSVILEVEDTGIGMPQEVIDKCLEPFFTTKGERGTGLGLAMVFGIVQRHNAEIDIQSETGKGTRIRILFPLPDAASFATNKKLVDAVPSRMRLLVIDDDPLMLKALSDILRTDGHVVVTANGGLEGLDTFRSDPKFNVVITDLGMPYVDGRKVAKTIKELSPATPVILLTGWGQRILDEGDIPPHVNRVLSKPPKVRDIRQALLEVT